MTVEKMPPHHVAWLSNHPGRSFEWFKEMIAHGFDVHHMDGNHFNNDPDNLVLIEHIDHMRLHGMNMTYGRLRKIPAKSPPRRRKRLKETAQERKLRTTKEIAEAMKEYERTKAEIWGIVN